MNVATSAGAWIPSYAKIVTLSNTALLERCIGIEVDLATGTPGLVKVEWAEAPAGEIDTISLATAGLVYRGAFRRLRATGSTAANVRAFFLV